jgi:hypothetical protein
MLATINRTFVLLFLFISFTSFAQQDQLGTEYFYRADCIKDIQQLQLALSNAHPALYTYTNKKDFNKKISEYIYNLPDSINSYQFHSDLTLLVNQVRDGHLYLSTNQTMNHFELSQGHLLPFTFRIFDYKLFIQSNLGDSKLTQWDVITKINGIPTTELIYELLPLLPTDGYCSSRKLKLLEENFALLYARHYGFSTSYQIQSISKDTHSKPTISTIQGISTKTLFSKQKKQTLYFEIDKAKSRAYLKIPTFNSLEIERAEIDWSKWLKTHFKQAKKDSIQSFILDLRGNEGGNVKLMSELMEYLMNKDFQLYNSIIINPLLIKNEQLLLTNKQTKKLKKQTRVVNDSLVWNEKLAHHYYFPKKSSFKDDLYVLMDGGTYSSASHAIQLLKHRTNTKFFGTETGGNGIGSNAGKTLIISLKNSKFNLHIPLMRGIYKTNKVFSLTSGVLPDKYCGNELLMELKYTDICLLNVLEYIARKNK